MIRLVKEKRCGKIKGCTCADVRPLSHYIKNEDAASPTISMEAFAASFMIDIYENWYVEILGVPGGIFVPKRRKIK